MTLPFPVQVQHVGCGMGPPCLDHSISAQTNMGTPGALGYGTPCARSPQDLENLLDLPLGNQGPHHEAGHKEEVEAVPDVQQAEEQGAEAAFVDPK